ncbi:lipocalin-like domain-containing protein [Cereibacter johrii]|uniref:lipocalin-like domain-containing protein n=1 Tax=Cereibacter johrii TaxID=445629 RepID=UPI002B25D2DF|nr:lipocalin-like domain-containing protein [Cereibacter johrii]MEA5162982.1 lipocalin-like domain-containing protein [Cereibacter johrii]
MNAERLSPFRFARRIAAAILLATLGPAAPAGAQGFAGLGATAEGFATPQRGQPLVFPRDHGPHPEYRIEWWYLTSVLTGEDGQDYGIQWTLFRSALAPHEGAGWESPQLWLGHAALTTPERHLVAERYGRGGIGQAGVTARPFEAWIDDWHMTGSASPGADALSALTLAASGAGFSYDLRLEAEGPLVAQGANGYSVKSAAGQASWYYSQPFYRVEGRIEVEGKRISVTGEAWLDREWSSQPLAEDQTGWDWFSLMFDDGARLMGFRLRDGGEGYTSATWISPDGRAEPMPPGALRVTPGREAEVAGRKIPVEWRMELPAKGLDVTVEAMNDSAWMETSVPYWEGPIAIRGSHAGRGYLEMTGY